MKSAKEVDQLIAQWKAEGKRPEEIAWNAALACEGWPYVFGAWGAECTVAERKKRYREEHPTIRTKCRAYDGGSCSGCQWYPDGQRVRCFDCRGFTDWILKQAGIIDLEGEGATSQWNTNSNWSAKGPISTIPGNTLVCLFVQKGSKMEHTGLGYNNETVECSSGVQHFTSRKAKWTHWAVPIQTPTPAPEPTPERPTLRRGDKGPAVVEVQTMLDRLGYDLGQLGVDGDFGRMTRLAVITFQGDHKLTADGICGPATWAALIAAAETFVPVQKKYFRLTIPHLTETQAEELISRYPDAIRTEE